MNNNDLQSWMRHCDKKEDMTVIKTLISFLAILSILAFCIYIAAL